jgi:hypothetical protein
MPRPTTAATACRASALPVTPPRRATERDASFAVREAALVGRYLASEQMPLLTPMQGSRAPSREFPCSPKPAHVGAEVFGDLRLAAAHLPFSCDGSSDAVVRGPRHDEAAVANSGRVPRWQRGPGCRFGSTFVRGAATRPAGSGAAGDTSCELRPWSTSGSRSDPLGQTIVSSSGSTRTWWKTAGSRSGSPIGPTDRR